MLNMKTSADGRGKLTVREGRRLKAYKCSAGVWTIGIGHTSAAGLPKVTPGLRITRAQCDEIFARDLVEYERAVCKAVRVPVPQAAFDAMVSLCYNIGVHGFARSSVVRLLNAGDVLGAADAFLKWCKPAELRGRREDERAQFLSGYPELEEREDEELEPIAPKGELGDDDFAPAVIPPAIPSAPAAPWWSPSTWFSLSRKPEATAKGGLLVAGAGAAGSSGPQTVLEWLGAKSTELRELVEPLITYGNVFRTLAVAAAVVGVVVMLWAPKAKESAS